MLLPITNYQLSKLKYYFVFCSLFIAHCSLLILSGYAVANPLDLTKPPSSSPQPQLLTQQKLKIGCILPLSGEGADIGQRLDGHNGRFWSSGNRIIVESNAFMLPNAL